MPLETDFKSHQRIANFVGKMIAPLLLGILGLLSGVGQTSAQFQHPLDPLSSAEMASAVAIINLRKPYLISEGEWVFNWITLKEPEKALLLPYYLSSEDPPFNTSAIPRKAFVILLATESNIVVEAVVNLFAGTLDTWETLPMGTQVAFIEEESVKIAMADERVQERIRLMGWTNLDLVFGEIYPVGYVDGALANAVRPVQVLFYGMMFPGDNHYAHPFDFIVHVDLATRHVIGIVNLPTHSDFNANNTDGNVCPTETHNWNPRHIPPDFYRRDVHPISLSQPLGAGYTVRGNEVSWQKFKFHLGFNGREGAVISQLSYKDGDDVRPLFYRLSVSELFVPYADPRPPFHNKFVFDEGEFFLGYRATDLRKGGICRGGEASYLDVYLSTGFGNSTLFPAAVCIFEEDAGLLWAHYDLHEDNIVHTRSTRLSVMTFINVDNYDYKFTWRLYQDGSIELNTELHGIVSTHLLALNVTNNGGYGTIVAPQVNAPFHQHHIAFRLDAEVDGNINTVSMVEAVPVPGASGSSNNPYGQGFTTQEEVFTTPSNARSLTSPLTGRTWLVKNPTKMHPYTGKPVAYKLFPFNAPMPFVRKDSPMHARCAYTDYNVWVTKYREDQLFAGGFYNNGGGLPEWVSNAPDEDITQTDTVLWYVYGFTHVPRVEDFPIMPAESTGFILKPTNFFMQNPALDVPPQTV